MCIRDRALAFRDVFQQNQISFIEHETSPTSSRQLIQREPLAVIADFADCQSLSLWERCLRSRWRGQARQNETRKRSDTMSLTNRVCIAVRFAFCQHPCPLRRIRASSPKGRASGEEALCISPIHTGIYLSLIHISCQERWHRAKRRGRRGFVPTKTNPPHRASPVRGCGNGIRECLQALLSQKTTMRVLPP